MKVRNIVKGGLSLVVMAGTNVIMAGFMSTLSGTVTYKHPIKVRAMNASAEVSGLVLGLMLADAAKVYTDDFVDDLFDVGLSIKRMITGKKVEKKEEIIIEEGVEA